MNLIRLNRLDSNKSVYGQYRGGGMWKPSARGLGVKGEEFPLSICMLTRAVFMKRIGEIILRNEVGARWSAERCSLFVSMKESEMRIRLSQTPSIEGCSQFDISGKASKEFQRYNGWARLSLETVDLLGNRRRLAIFHDGRESPWLGIECGRYFSRVFMISSDGFRIRFVYGGSREFNVAVHYIADPRKLYAIELDKTGSSFVPALVRDSSIIGEVKLTRRLEQRMKAYGTAYDHGRLGAEIAYTVAMEMLRKNHVVLLEPSRGGKDLYSADGTLVIQARMLVRTCGMTNANLKEEVSKNLKRLLLKLEQDFHFTTTAEFGLAVLTFVDNQGVIKLISSLRCREKKPSVSKPIQMALNY
jgi:hypothetical protein